MNHDEYEAIARKILTEYQTRYPSQIVAAGIYGSVAYNEMTLWSDLEMMIVVSENIAPREERFFAGSLLIECDIVTPSQLWKGAHRVTVEWGLEADAYRHQWILWDPGQWFDRLRMHAEQIPSRAFEHALQESWWMFYEWGCKWRSAMIQKDADRIVSLSWKLAWLAALRWALFTRKPFRSERTMWRDMREANTVLTKLLDALKTPYYPGIQAALHDLWTQTNEWGRPSTVPERIGQLFLA
ncbi:kanamycin nucleotidyltransferase C-terminal domain-containing protein [Sulfobacillus thermosulfidooxidans]|uniref:kanamycin nucleotidyltransferase C-terminal domain-containing protein n=1 Tax=Sulfobacillus thermosulfidooxidans TaxID=28034 RepID=UPI0003085085|nr:kanamycin nucleotidyltransferase C-terminal domain-containing protein [Sulfobacillus thermosulfidooxidans]